MRVAIVGGGVFGATIATTLAESHHQVSLFDRKNALLQCASLVNQYRLHRGYHYPRSHQTIAQCVGAYDAFLARYGKCIVENVPHYYGIPKAESLTSARQCSKIWAQHGLRHWHTDLTPLAKPEMLEDWFEVEEATISIDTLREIIKDQINSSGVRLHLGVSVYDCDLIEFDRVIVCAYSENNSFLARAGLQFTDWQYEVCEKPVFRLPEYLQNKSVVLIDGNFMCIDPIGHTSHSVVGNVRHAIISRNTGTHPAIPEHIHRYINQGLITSPDVTNVELFIRDGTRFFDDFSSAVHIGSYYTVRMVPADRDHDDARPTELYRLSDRITAVYSGKIVTCAYIAQEISRMLE